MAGCYLTLRGHLKFDRFLSKNILWGLDPKRNVHLAWNLRETCTAPHCRWKTSHRWKVNPFLHRLAKKNALFFFFLIRNRSNLNKWEQFLWKARLLFSFADGKHLINFFLDIFSTDLFFEYSVMLRYIV